MTCPLHHAAVCPCSRGYVTQWELDRAFAVGLWECDHGHRIVAAPVLPLGNGGSLCFVCRGRMVRISTCIVRPRPAQARLAS